MLSRNAIFLLSDPSKAQYGQNTPDIRDTSTPHYYAHFTVYSGANRKNSAYMHRADLNNLVLVYGDVKTLVCHLCAKEDQFSEFHSLGRGQAKVAAERKHFCGRDIQNVASAI